MLRPDRWHQQGKGSQGCPTCVCSPCCFLATCSFCSHRLSSESSHPKFFPNSLSSSRLDPAVHPHPNSQQTAIMPPAISLSNPYLLMPFFSPAEFSSSSSPEPHASILFSQASFHQPLTSIMDSFSSLPLPPTLCFKQQACPQPFA